MAAQLNTLICKGCGASLSYAAGLQALQCEYCEAVTEIPRAAPPAGTTAQLLIPMTLEDNALAYGVLQYLAANDQVPDDMVERAVLSVKRFYMPCFAFKGFYNASWTASFGYNRTESYTAYTNQRVNGVTERVPVTRNRTVVDWRPVNGQAVGSFALLGYGGSGLPPSAPLLLDRLRNLQQATRFDVGFVGGMETPPYTMAANESYAINSEAQVAKLVEASVMQHAQGDKQRDWHWNASTNWNASAVYVPVGHVVLEYGGKHYNAWVDGTDAANVATDALPLNAGKSGHMARGMILPLGATMALMLAAMLSISALHELTMERLAAIGVLWGLWEWRNRRRARRSQQTRQAALAKRAARYGQPVTTPAEAPDKGADWLSVVISLVSAVIAGVLIYKLINDPAAPPEAVAAVAAPAAATVAPAMGPGGAPARIDDNAPGNAPGNASDNTPGKPVRPLSPLMAAASAQDWETVRTLTANAPVREPVAQADKAASAAAYAHGVKALLNKDNEAAITAFDLAIESNVANMDARSKLGAALIRAGDHARARKVLGQLVDAAPGHIEGWRNMAEAAALAGHPAEADASLQMLLHLSKNRKRTTDALKKRAASGKPDQFSEAVARVLKPGARKTGK